MSQEQFQAVINSPWMWLACGVMVFIVIAQSVVYLRSAIREAGRLGIDAKRRHGAIRSACITSLGPSLSPVIIALSMITIIGAPNTWLYLNNVGAARTELATAAIGAEFAGVFELGGNIGMSALSCAMWACALNGVGWMIVVFFLNHRMQRISDALYAKFDRALVSALMGAAVTSLFCYLLGNQLVSGSWRHYLAAAISGGCMLLLGYIGLGFGAQAMLRRKKARESMKQRLSETIIPELLSEVFDEVEYDHRGFIDGALIESIDMHFPFKYDAVIGSDHIRARYRGVDIEMSDILLDSVTVLTSEDDDGDIETHEVHRNRFRGQWIILDLHRELTSDLCIFEDGRKKKGQVETENEAFNEKFGVTCENEHDAFYILTPHLMDHIMTLDERAGGNTYMRFLKEGKVHVAVNSGRDHFELERLNVSDVGALRRRFRGEVEYVTALVDELLAVNTMFRK